MVYYSAYKLHEPVMHFAVGRLVAAVYPLLQPIGLCA